MTTTALLSFPIFRAFTAGGIPLAGGLLYTYAANSTTPLTTWNDAAGTQPNTNPVVLDSTGSAVVRLDPTLSYKFVLQDSGGSTQWTADYYESDYLTAASLGAILNPTVAAEGSSVTNGGFPYGYPQRYGGAGDGITDDTVAVQGAFNSGYEVTLSGGLVFLVSNINVNNSIVMRGYGTLKQKASSTGSMIYAAPGTSYGFEADGPTFDGNQSAQGANSGNFILDFRAVSATGRSTLRVNRCTFQNAALADIRCFSNQTGGVIDAFITNNQFIGGASGDGATYGPRYVDVADAVNLTMTGNHVDFLQTPGSGVFGKAGLVTYYNQAESVPTPNNFSVWVRTIVSNNYFNNCGRDQAATQGPIDLYGYAVDAVIANNVIRNFAGRGICVKGTDPRVVINGNTVDTSPAGVAQASTGIICNPSTTTDFYNDISISNNIVNNVSGYGILVSGLNVTAAAGTRQGVRIANNIIRGAGTGGGAYSDIYLQACLNADVFGNQCFSGAGSTASIVLNVCQGLITIKNNQLISHAARGILSNDGDNNSLAFLEINENLIYSPGNAGPGSAMYLGGIGGANIGDGNRLINCQGTAVLTDQSAVFTGSTSGTTLTVTAMTSGIIAVGQVIYAPATSANPISIPGTYISAILTGTGGVGTYTLSTSPTNVASQVFATVGNTAGPTVGGSLAVPKIVSLHNNTLGMVTITSREHYLDTQGSAATGNLVWINGGYPGQLCTFYSVNGGRVVTLKDCAATIANGNINLGADFPLTTTKNSITLYFNGTFWQIAAKN